MFVLYRVEDHGAVNYSLRRSEYDGLPVFEIVNNLDYRDIEETVLNRTVEDRFAQVLDTVRPDVVHFQHCLHLSVSLVPMTRDRGIPAFVHLHDYWFVCPKVQLIRPDRSVCTVRKPGLACVVCSTDPSPTVRVAKVLHALVPPLVDLAVLVCGRLSRKLPFLRRRVLLDAVALRRRLKVMRQNLDRANLLISPSAFLKERYVGHGFACDHVLFSRNGLAATGLEAVVRSPSRKIRFAFAGSLLWYKGVDVLIRAFNQIDPEKAILRIHGDFEKNLLAREHYESLTPLVESPAIQFAGAYCNEDLAKIYAETDVLVVPSIWYENSPLTIQEAFAAGTPVIASRLGAMKDLVKDRVNGLLFEPGDAVDLARRIREILDDPSLLDHWRRNIPSVKTIAANAVEIEILYRQALMLEVGSPDDAFADPPR